MRISFNKWNFGGLTSLRPRRNDHRQDIGKLDFDVGDRGGAGIRDDRLPELLERLRKSSPNDMKMLPGGKAVVLDRPIVGNDLEVSGQTPRLKVPPDRELRFQDEGEVPRDAFIYA